MPNYENTPLASDWEKIKRQREIARVLTEQSLSGGGNEMISGRVVPGWGKDLGRVGKALASGYSGRKTDEQQQALSDRYDADSRAAMESVVDTIRGRGGATADPQKAALDATVDPYLRGNKSTQSVINAMIKADAVKQGRGGYPSFQFISTPEGIVKGNRRTGDLDPTTNPYMRATDDIEHQAEMARQKQLSLGSAELETDPATARAVGDETIITQQQIAEDKAIVTEQYAAAIEDAKASGRQQGEARTEAEINLPQTFDAYEKSISLIDELTAHPGFKDAVGFPDNPFTLGGLVPWTDAAGFRKRLDQLSGRGFMEVFPTLKGGGPITDVEGGKAQASINRMSQATSEKEFLAASEDFKRELFRLKKVTADRAGAVSYTHLRAHET